jgi:uncharacterized protein YdeI (YjbR/CyaY-like superfamily)
VISSSFLSFRLLLSESFLRNSSVNQLFIPMPTLDSRVDAYIQKSQPFAQPILHRLRALVHQACPQVVETIKWGFPVFEHKGIMCHMASFKQHCAFGFWKVPLMNDPVLMEKALSEEAMGHLGKLCLAEDIPEEKVMIGWIKKAVELNEQGVKISQKPAANKPELPVPDALQEALETNEAALKVFENFAPSHRKEYIQWINEAKTEATRDKRVATAIEWISEGKQRNWKYQK